MNNSESKHTPGPWRVRKNQVAGVEYIEYEYAKGCYGDIARVKNLVGKEESNKNARLMAAAPDLLDACWEALRWIEEQRADAYLKTGSYPIVVRTLKDAIAIATGKEKSGCE